MLKAFCDAADPVRFDAVGRRIVGLGGVVIDEEGREVLQFSVKTKIAPHYPAHDQLRTEYMEWLALEEMLKRIIAAGISEVIVHTDSLSLVKRWETTFDNEDAFIPSPIDEVLPKCEELAWGVGDVNVKWVRREANTRADALAKKAAVYD
jgi:ribonuclease HI